MNAHRLFAPAFRVKAGNRSLEPAQAACVSDITVMRALDAIDHFSMTLANSYPTHRWTKGGDRTLFDFATPVTVELGYVDDLDTVFTGEVTDFAADFPSDGAATLRVEGLNRLHRLGRNARSRTFQKVTDSDIVTMIAEEEGLTPLCENTGLEHETVEQINMTNLSFLRQRAKDFAFEFYVDDRKLVFRKPRTGAKAIRMEWGRGLRGIQFRLDGAGPATEVNVVGIDKDGTSFVGRAKAGGERNASGSRAALGSRVVTVVDRKPASKKEADLLAKAILDESARAFLTGSGEADGFPGLKPGMLIEFGDLGPRYDGRYYVTQTTHTFGSTGYTTSFSVERSAEP